MHGSFTCAVAPEDMVVVVELNVCNAAAQEWNGGGKIDGDVIAQSRNVCFDSRALILVTSLAQNSNLFYYNVFISWYCLRMVYLSFS